MKKLASISSTMAFLHTTPQKMLRATGSAKMAVSKITRSYTSSSSYKHPPSSQDKLSLISAAITAADRNPERLKKLLPPFTTDDITNLITLNPQSLSPVSLLALFHHPTFRHSIDSYTSMAHFLSSLQFFPEARSLIRLVISLSAKGSASSVFASLLHTRGTHFRSTYVFHALINTYIEFGFVGDAVHCFRSLCKHGFRIPFQTSAHLLDSMLKSNTRVVVSWGFLLEIFDSGSSPFNVYNFNILMHKLCRHGLVREAQRVFDEIGKRGLAPTVVSFNTLINGYAKCGNLEHGFKLKEDMEGRGVRPDLFTYSVFINGLCKQGRLDAANDLFDEMCARGLLPNDVIFTNLIDGLCKNGKHDMAIKMYQKMLGRGIKPDTFTYNTLINGLCKVENMKEAWKLVMEMSASGFKPDKITYTTLIDAYCKEGELESAIEIRKQMIKNEIELDNVAFTALISGFCREGRIIEAEKMLREMLKAGMKPDDATYTIVMDGFCKTGDVNIGFKLLKEMQSDGRIPSVVTYNVLMNGLCKQGQMRNANMLLNAMINVGVVPDDITYNILLEGHCKHGNPDNFEKLWREKGLVLDYASYNSLVKDLNKSSKNHQKR